MLKKVKEEIKLNYYVYYNWKTKNLEMILKGLLFGWFTGEKTKSKLLHILSVKHILKSRR